MKATCFLEKYIVISIRLAGRVTSKLDVQGAVVCTVRDDVHACGKSGLLSLTLSLTIRVPQSSSYKGDS